MIYAEKIPDLLTLAMAKVWRREATEAVKATEISASCASEELKVCSAEVATLEEARRGFVAAARIDDVIATEERLLKARIAVEVQASKAASLTARHVAAVAELHDSVVAVDAAGSLSIDGYMVELAHEIVRVLDAVLLPLGEELRELSMRDGQPTALGAKSTLPPEVARALERLPKRNQLNIPINELR